MTQAVIQVIRGCRRLVKDMHSIYFKLVLVIALVLMFGLVWVSPASIDAAEPSFNLSKTSGPIGTRVMLSACGMTPGNIVEADKITFNGQPWNKRSLPIDSAGCLCATELIVPVAPVGPNAVVVDDGNIKAIGVFTITQPNIVVSPTTGYKSQVLTVTGSGWVSPSFVTVTFQGGESKIVAPDAGGSFQIELTVPLTAKDKNIISARDNIGNFGPEVLFLLKPAGLMVNPVSGLPGTGVQLTGWGFEPFTTVENVRIGDHKIPAPGLTTDKSGAFAFTFQAPNLPAGGHTVGATVAGLSMDTCFTILLSDVWIPVVDDNSTPVEVALAGISDYLIRVWGYHNSEWKMYDPLDPLGCTLTGLVSGRAYWIKVSDDCRLIFRDLRPGWNNIGW